jgi:3-oxoadipate CoA-transferase alpha subunit
MKTQIYESAIAAVADIPDGTTILVGGFGNAGLPTSLIHGLIEAAPKNLTIVSNNAGNAEIGLAALLRTGSVRKIICSFPRQSDSWVFDELYRSGKIELELVPQGTLAERIRAGGAGLGPFFSPVGVRTELENGRELREYDGKTYVLETPIVGDFALIQAHIADDLGNLTYRKTARNFGPIMATAGQRTIVEVRHLVQRGQLDPESIITPGVYVDRLVHIGRGSIG